jgi:tetratricopeptide (TPR) repeat protein
LSKALELSPSYYLSNINRGLAYAGLEKYDEALDDFNRALEFGDIPAAYSGRGTVYYFQGKYDEAITDLELATQMNPNSARSYCVLAYTYFEVGRFEDALEAALRVEEISPECGGQKRFEVMIQSYYAVGRYEDGIAFITMTFDVRGQIYFLGYYYRGIMYDEIGKPQEAIKDLEFFLAAEKSFAEIYPEEIADAKARLATLKP